MNNKEYLNFIKGCETKYKVSEWKMGDMHLWPIVRCYLFKKLVKAPSTRTNVFSTLRIRLKHTINWIKDWRHTIWFPSKCDVLFLGNGSTKSLFEKHWYDYLVQPVMEPLNKSGQTCLFLERGIFYRYPRSCESFLTRTFEEVAVILAKIAACFIPKNRSIEKLTPSKPLIAYAQGVKFISYFYSMILAITKPKEVYIVCYYTMAGMAMCYACSKKGIPTFELQHGNTHNNFAYQGWQQAPHEGYNTMPKHFWFWTENDKQEFLTSNSKSLTQKISATVYGIPWIPFWKSADRRVLKYQSQLLARSNKYKFNILVTLRPDIFGGNEWDGLAELIEEMKESVFWWIRKHPTISDSDPHLQRITSINQANVDYALAGTLPLFSLLRISNLHITTASNVAVEAKLFDVDTIFISDLAELEMPNIIDNKSIQIITNTMELRSVIESYPPLVSTTKRI